MNTQSPLETIRYSLDFSEFLIFGETPSILSITSTPANVVVSQGLTPQNITVDLGGMTNGTTYRLDVECVTNAGNKYGKSELVVCEKVPVYYMTKRSADSFVVSIDISNWLIAGDSVSNAAITIIDNADSTATNVASTMSSGLALWANALGVNAGAQFTILAAGANLHTYMVSVAHTTSLGLVYETIVELKVQDR